MNFHKLKISQVRALTAAIAFSTTALSLPAHAIIPVTDWAGIVQDVLNFGEEIAQWDQQIDGMKDQFEQTEKQFKETKDLMTGNSGYGKLLNSNELVNYLPTDTANDSWSTIYKNMDQSALRGLRDKYSMSSENAVQQEAYDTELTNLSTLQKTYAATNKRLANIKGLQSLADDAQTPQEKQDIVSRIGLEQAAIQNDKNRMDTSVQLMAQNDKLIVRKQNQSFGSFMAGNEE